MRVTLRLVSKYNILPTKFRIDSNEYSHKPHSRDLKKFILLKIREEKLKILNI